MGGGDLFPTSKLIYMIANIEGQTLAQIQPESNIRSHIGLGPDFWAKMGRGDLFPISKLIYMIAYPRGQMLARAKYPKPYWPMA